MISKKLYKGDGVTRRFLSDFTIKTYEFAKPYMWYYDSALPLDGSGDHLQHPGMFWSYPDNLYVRGKDAPTSQDLVGASHWEVLDNSVSLYESPMPFTQIWIEVATNLEEFGETLLQPAVEDARLSAVLAKYYADRAEESALEALDTLQDVKDEGDYQVDRVIDAGDVAVEAAWDSEAEAMTSDSYAQETPGLNVIEYVSNDDGTFTELQTNNFSSLHWALVSRIISSGLTYKGQWDPTTGAYPVGPYETGDTWVVVVEGMFDDVYWYLGDYLIRNVANDDFDRFPNVVSWAGVTNVPTNVVNAITAIDLQVETDRALAAEAGLQDNIDGKANTVHSHDDIYFGEDEHIIQTLGAEDAGKPVKTNSVGKLSMSFMEIGGFEYEGGFTPTPAEEYPDTTGLPFGSFWSLKVNYTWTTGDLAGQYGEENDLIIFGNASWILRETNLDPTDYYRLDGSTPLKGHFAGGGYRLTNIAPSGAPTDGVQKDELDYELGYKSNLGHHHSQYQVNDLITDLADRSLVGHSHIVSDTTGLQHALDEKAFRAHTHSQYINDMGDTMKGDLIFHGADTTRIVFAENTKVKGALYHSHQTDQVVLARYADNGLDIETQLILGTDGVSISGFNGGYPVIESDQDLVTKKYADSIDADKVSKTGDTMTGNLIINRDNGSFTLRPNTTDGTARGAIQWHTHDNNKSNNIGVNNDSTRFHFNFFDPTDGAFTGQFILDSAQGTGNRNIWHTGNFDPTDYATDSELTEHTNRTNNPHQTSASHVGLGNANNTSDADKPISTATQTALDLSFKKTEHIFTSAGAADQGKPIVLDSTGGLDHTILGSGLYPVDTWIPTPAEEYPDATGEERGAYWIIGDVGIDGYEFTGGDMVGIILFEGDAMILGVSGWTYLHIDIAPEDYYKLDASQAIIQPFAGGGQQFKNAAPGSEDGDLVTYEQISDFATNFLLVNGNNDMIGPITIKYNNPRLYFEETENVEATRNAQFIYENNIFYLRFTELTDGTNYNDALRVVNKLDGEDTFTPARQIQTTPTDLMWSSNIVWHEGNFDPTEVADGQELADHIGNTSNPHGVNKGQLSLGNVDNTTDLGKPISTATQSALNLKSPTGHNHDGTYALTTDLEAYFPKDGSEALTGRLTVEDYIVSKGSDTEDTRGFVCTDTADVPRLLMGFDVATNVASISRRSSANASEATIEIEASGNIEALNGAAGVPTPANDGHLANKKYVDAQVATKLDIGGKAADSALLNGMTPLELPVSNATQNALDDKVDDGHTHAISEVSGLQEALDGKPTGSWTFDGTTLAITIG